MSHIRAYIFAVVISARKLNLLARNICLLHLVNTCQLIISQFDPTLPALPGYLARLLLLYKYDNTYYKPSGPLPIYIRSPDSHDIMQIKPNQTQPSQGTKSVSHTHIPRSASEKHGSGFCDFLNAAPSVYHAVGYYVDRLEASGYVYLAERDDWSELQAGGKYFFTRNYSSLIAFTVGKKYRAGNGIALIGTHIDALTMSVKPVSTKSSVGYLQLGVAPYAGGGNMTWWDRDLGLAGRVMVANESGDITQKLLRMPYPIAKIPTLAPHFGAPARGPFDQETQMTPIIGLEAKTVEEELVKQFNKLTADDATASPLQNHSPRLLKAVAKQLGTAVENIKDFDLELFDFQPAQPFGLDGDLLSVPRCDDKLCSYVAMEALLDYTSDETNVADSGVISMVFLSDKEEVGSKLRQGAGGNMVPMAVERIVDVFNTSAKRTQNLVAMTYAKSFLFSADVKHAVNPNVSC